MAVKLTKQGKIFFTIVAAVAIVGLVVVSLILQHNQKIAAVKPSYQTVLPAKTTADQLGGWRRISPQNSDPVYAYSDTIDGVKVDVSEQPLPASFKDDVPGKIADLAKQFNATTKLDGDPVIYLGTSAQGPQSVIFTKNNLLILIKSASAVSSASWQKYAQSLK